MTDMTEEDRTIQLWGIDGARAGALIIHPNGCEKMSVIQINIAICGLKNFDFWWHYIYGQVQEILCKQSVAQEKIAKAKKKTKQKQL